MERLKNDISSILNQNFLRQLSSEKIRSEFLGLFDSYFGALKSLTVNIEEYEGLTNNESYYSSLILSDCMHRYAQFANFYFNDDSSRLSDKIVRDWKHDRHKINGKKYTKDIKKLDISENSTEIYEYVISYIRETTKTNQTRAKQIALLSTQHCFAELIIPIQMTIMSMRDNSSNSLLIRPDAEKKLSKVEYSNNKLKITISAPFKDTVQKTSLFTLENSVEIIWVDNYSFFPMVTNVDFNITRNAQFLPPLVTHVLNEIQAVKFNWRQLTADFQQAAIKMFCEISDKSSTRPLIKEILAHAQYIMMGKSREEHQQAQEILTIKESLGLSNTIARDYKFNLIDSKLTQGYSYVTYTESSQIPSDLRKTFEDFQKFFKQCQSASPENPVKKIHAAYSSFYSSFKRKYDAFFTRLLKSKTESLNQKSDILFWDELQQTYATKIYQAKIEQANLQESQQAKKLAENEQWIGRYHRERLNTWNQDTVSIHSDSDDGLSPHLIELGALGH